jgi:hypothetical protein
MLESVRTLSSGYSATHRHRRSQPSVQARAAAVRLAVTEDLAPGTFAFNIGCLRTTPYLALPADVYLVNDTPERITSRQASGSSPATSVEARPALNPASGQPGAIVRTQDLKPLTLGSTGHFIPTGAVASSRRASKCWIRTAF